MTLCVLYDKRDSMASSPRTKGFCFLCLKKNTHTHTNECPEEAFPSDDAGSQVSQMLESCKWQCAVLVIAFILF